MSALFFRKNRRAETDPFDQEQMRKAESAFLCVVSAYGNKPLRPGEQIYRYLTTGKPEYITQTQNARNIAASVQADKWKSFFADKYVGAILQGFHPNDGTGQGKELADRIRLSQQAGEDPRLSVLSILLQDNLSVEGRKFQFDCLVHLINAVIRFYRISNLIPDTTPDFRFELPPEELKEEAEFEEVFSAIINSMTSLGIDPAEQMTGYLLTGDLQYIPKSLNARNLAENVGEEQLTAWIASAFLKWFKRESRPESPESLFLSSLADACSSQQIDPAMQLTGYVLEQDPKYLPKSIRTRFSEMIDTLETEDLLYYMISGLI